MTKSTITDERITSVIERLEHFASNLKWTDVRGAQDLLTAADGLRELQERRKADSEPVAVVPDERPSLNNGIVGFDEGWNACRAAMLQAEPVTTANKLGNSPVIPDGYVMVPKDATLDMLKAGAKQEMKGEAFQYVWQAMLAAAPELPGLEPAAPQEVKSES